MADEIRQELLRTQARGGGKRAAPRDVDALDQWMFDYAARHGPKKVDDLAEPLRPEAQQEMARIKAPALAARVPALVWLRNQLSEAGKPPAMAGKVNASTPSKGGKSPAIAAGGSAGTPNEAGKPLAITAEELANLRAHLATPALKQHLESLSESDQRQVLTTLMKRLVDWHFANHRFGQSWLAVSDDELAQFLEKLDPEQRDKLLRLPNDEMQRELVVRYWRWKLSEELPWLIFPHHGRNPVRPPGGSHPDVKKADAGHDKPGKGKGKGKVKSEDRPGKTPTVDAKAEKADASPSPSGRGPG